MDVEAELVSFHFAKRAPSHDAQALQQSVNLCWRKGVQECVRGLSMGVEGVLLLRPCYAMSLIGAVSAKIVQHEA